MTGSVLSCTRITRYDFITLPTISNQTIAAALQVLSVARQLPTPAARPSNMEGETTETGESLKRQKTFKIAKKFISPKVDVLGPDIPYVPKKIKINNPLPDLNSVSVKIDNEGLQIVHLPKEVHVNKGTPKFNVQSKVDNKGIDIFHGNTPDFRLPEQAKRDPTRHNFINFQVKSDPVKSVKVMSSGSDSQYPPTDSWDEGRADNIPRAAVQRLASPLPDQDTVPPASPPSSSPAPSSSTSSPGPSSPSLPPTPPPFSPHPTSPVLTVDRLSPKRSQTNLGGLEEKLSNDELASLSQDVSLPTVQARTTMESLATAAISPEPRHAAPPPAVSSSSRRSSPAVRETEHPHAVPTPPPRVPPTPLPCKIIQVSPVPHQDFYGQTDFDQEPEDFPKKEKRFNWKCFVILIILLFLFIGAGIGVGYAVGLLGGEEVECGTGTVRSGSHCLQVATTSPASPASSSSAPLCSGCDCAQDILLDPDNSTAVQTVLVSPRYPNKYKHSADCRWTVRATRGQLQLTFTKFNLQWAQNCRDNDFVFLDQVSVSKVLKV